MWEPNILLQKRFLCACFRRRANLNTSAKILSIDTNHTNKYFLQINCNINISVAIIDCTWFILQQTSLEYNCQMKGNWSRWFLLFYSFLSCYSFRDSRFFYFNWTGRALQSISLAFQTSWRCQVGATAGLVFVLADDIDHESLFGSTPKRIHNSDPNQNLDSICFSVSISKQNFALACVCDKKLTKFLDVYLWSIPFKFRST